MRKVLFIFRKFSIFTHFELLSVGPKNFSTRKGEEVLAVKIVPSKFKTWFKIEAKLCIWIRTPFFASKINLDKINFHSTYKQYLFYFIDNFVKFKVKSKKYPNCNLRQKMAKNEP